MNRIHAPVLWWRVQLYHNDHLWTSQRLTDTSGEVTWSGRAEAFGKTAAIVNQVENRLRFPGQYFDAESGLHYNYFRDYISQVGRYAQRDVIGLRGGVNVFNYALGNSIVKFDPNGLYSFDRSCRTGQRRQITRAIYEAWTKCERCGKYYACDEEEENGIRKKVCDRLSNPPEQFVCAATNEQDTDRGNVDACGVNDARAVITLTPAAFTDSGCGCLSSTIFHEVAHSLMTNTSGDHSLIDRMEQRCFSCNAKTTSTVTVRP